MTASHTLVDVVLSSRSRAAISLGITEAGEQIVSAIDGDDAAAHLCIGDVVLLINGREPSLTNCWQQEAAPERASVLTLRVRRQKGSGSAAASPLTASSPGAASGGYAVWGSFGGYGLAPGLFSLPASILALPDGDLVVADGGACRLQIVSPEGELRHVLGSFGELPGELNYPAGLAADDDGNLFVADRGNCRVQKLRIADGAPLASTAPTARRPAPSAASSQEGATQAAEAGGEAGGEEGGEDDEAAEEEGELLNYPWGIALDGAGRVFTSDMRGRICVLDDATLALLCCHTPRDPPGSPHGMAIWRDELFVADHDNHRVLALRLGGASGAPYFAGGERAIGSYGAAPGQFEHPIGLAVLEGKLLVSEFTGRRVQALDAASGAPLFALPAPANTRLLGLCALEHRIYVGDFDVDRVHCWESLQSPASRSRRASRDFVRRSSRDTDAPLIDVALPREGDAAPLPVTEEEGVAGSPDAKVCVDASGSDFTLVFNEEAEPYMV